MKNMTAVKSDLETVDAVREDLEQTVAKLNELRDRMSKEGKSDAELDQITRELRSNLDRLEVVQVVRIVSIDDLPAEAIDRIAAAEISERMRTDQGGGESSPDEFFGELERHYPTG